MCACVAWLRHQHTAEENLLDRCRRQEKTMSFCALGLCSSATVPVAIDQLQLNILDKTPTPAESLLISSLTGFLLPEM